MVYRFTRDGAGWTRGSARTPPPQSTPANRPPVLPVQLCALCIYSPCEDRRRIGAAVAASKGVMRVYRLLLYLYPASFRADYGEEMAAIFQSQLRAARGAARLTLWSAVLHEVVMNAPAAHWDIL